MQARDPYLLTGLYRALKVLDCFTLEDPELRLTDLAVRLGMSKPQVLRIVSTLESAGYLVRDPETKRYRLGIRLFQLGMIVGEQLDLRRIGHPFLRRLVDETGETARLFVPDYLGPICIDLVESPRRLRVFARLGSRLPWHAGASSRVILAYLENDVRESILAHQNFERFTAKTTMDLATLRAELQRIRENGFCVTMGDLLDDTLAIAAPVLGHANEILGAVSLVGPASRFPPPVLGRSVELVRQTAADISSQVGHTLPCPVDTSSGKEAPIE